MASDQFYYKGVGFGVMVCVRVAHAIRLALQATMRGN